MIQPVAWMAEKANVVRFTNIGASADELERLGWAVVALHAAPQPQPPSIEAAHEMGAKGGPVDEGERMAFEAWMRGHCWAPSSTWDGKQYRGDAEQGGDLDPRAMGTRRLWAAWRDRAALAQGERT